MRTVILQTDIVWGDAEANRRNLTELIGAYEGVDLFVLPEMFATGFGFPPQQVAEPEVGGPTLEWMRRMAQEGNCAVAGSVAVRTASDTFRNRFYFVFPDGNVEYYDKRHLFAFGGEHLEYTPGDRRVIVTYKGFRILLQVCYDLRFPVWMRNRNDYDMMLFVANWPVGRRAVWDVLLQARAIENQCYVLGVNRVGTDPVATYNGGSIILNAYGKTVAACEEGAVCGAEVVLELEPLLNFRRRFPVLEDRDGFEIKV